MSVHVNGVPVDDIEDFMRRVKNGEDISLSGTKVKKESIFKKIVSMENKISNVYAVVSLAAISFILIRPVMNLLRDKKNKEIKGTSNDIEDRYRSK